jgi:hypothetical protein
MVATNETLLDARTTNHPVAAAQPRPPASAKCRPASGASSRLYINGANTYQFVMSNPVGAVDPTGEFGAPGLAFNFVWTPSEGLHQTEGWEKKTLQFTDPVTGTELSTVASVEIEATGYPRAECRAAQWLASVFHLETKIAFFPPTWSESIIAQYLSGFVDYSGKLVDHPFFPAGFELVGSEEFYNTTLTWDPHQCKCMRITAKGGVEVSRREPDYLGDVLEGAAAGANILAGAAALSVLGGAGQVLAPA